MVTLHSGAVRLDVEVGLQHALFLLRTQFTVGSQVGKVEQWAIETGVIEIDDGEKIWLIDFDYAGFNSPLFDLANLASNSELDDAQEQELLQRYFDAAPGAALQRSFQAMKCASLLRETLWSMSISCCQQGSLAMRSSALSFIINRCSSRVSAHDSIDLMRNHAKHFFERGWCNQI